MSTCRRRAWSPRPARLEYPSGVPEPRNSILVELLVELFSEPQLRRFFIGVDLRGDVRHELPESTSLMTLAHAGVAEFERRGCIHQQFFAALRKQREGRCAEIDAVAKLWAEDLAAEARLVASGGAAEYRPLTGPAAFVDPAARSSEGGLRLLDIQPVLDSDGRARAPVLRFILKNEAAGSLTLIRVMVHVACHERRAVLSTRALEPSAAWDIELPAAGGQAIFVANPPFVIDAGGVLMLEVRCHVAEGQRRLPPAHCGQYTLRFGFRTGEGAWAHSEPIAC